MSIDAQPTLICIPDISGFTEFMSAADFELSSKVIPSLLNNIIYSNEIGLEVSEIEGDAVLFFKHGKLPPLKTLIDQCTYFYTEFYNQLDTLKQNHPDAEQAKLIPDILGLKIILHYGQEVAPVKVGVRIKLLGEDLIVAHRLLKNKIPIDEYLLLSDKLLQEYSDEKIDIHLNSVDLEQQKTDYAHVGVVKYHYIPLSTLISPDSTGPEGK